ncbi:mechanosensitive ion channel [Lutibacter sp. A64]|uniref:mechanosensitive ion channel family protein n=1 Tax=Lutibacter sp. A64 TaxID=2918526 RepID=UPI001F065773|nr:mechanosensitive ion channel domain-containing protein [Lutibacter sp. A64]UMB53616.1 mechanosensitive ion channel [Lutibacter sp. A64]
MKLITQIQDADYTFVQNLWHQLSNVIPKFLMVIAFIILAWIVLKVVNYILKKILKLSKIDSLTTKLNEAELFGKNDYDIVPSQIVLKFVKYLIILVFIVIASESLGLTMISEGIASFIGYLPVLISALLIFVVGVYLASIIKKAVQDTLKSLEVNGSNLVGNIVFYAIVVVVSITALNQAGIDTEIITSNLTLILGSVLLSFTIAFGLGARDVVTRLLFGFYSRKNFEVGQHIKTKNIEGKIQQIDNISITIKTTEGLVVLPIKKFVDQKVEIM